MLIDTALESLREHDAELTSEIERLEKRRTNLREALEVLEGLDGDAPVRAVVTTTAPHPAQRRPEREPRQSTRRPPASSPTPRAGTKAPVTRGQVLALFDTAELVLSPAQIARMVDSTPAAVGQHLLALIRDGKLQRPTVGRYQRIDGTPTPARDPLEGLGPITKTSFSQEHARSVAGGGTE